MLPIFGLLRGHTVSRAVRSARGAVKVHNAPVIYVVGCECVCIMISLHQSPMDNGTNCRPRYFVRDTIRLGVAIIAGRLLPRRNVAHACASIFSNCAKYNLREPRRGYQSPYRSNANVKSFVSSPRKSTGVPVNLVIFA